MLGDKFWTRPPPPEKPSAPNDVKLPYEELMLGIWRVLVVKDSRFSMFNLRRGTISSTFLLLHRVLYDVYTISPRLFALTIVAEFWLAIEGPLSLYFSNSLFFFVSAPSPARSVLTSVTR
jgi:hypothetical protein